ncbi:MAG: hypothetical protein F6K31_09665 [Symploca sp. SIO2G7]|nr:hypothetical protein [Symploca sp. SIO2G7]
MIETVVWYGFPTYTASPNYKYSDRIQMPDFLKKSGIFLEKLSLKIALIF